MAEIIKHPLTMQQRIQQQMARRNAGILTPLPQTIPQPQQQRMPRTLLLDVSASMALPSENRSERRIDALRKLVEDMNLAPGHPVYAFSFDVAACDAERIPEPRGGTDLARAFTTLKSEGHRSIVLITDGEPDDAQEALDAAKDLNLEIFYVGSGKKPSFLGRLAKACGGTANQVSMNKELAATVRKLLLA